MSRHSRQREAIRDTLKGIGRPLSAKETWQAALPRCPGLAMATVYRALRQLVEEGWLEPVLMPGNLVVYEVAGLPHHHHFQCQLCNKTFDMAPCSGSLDELAPPGFEVHRHEIFLYGDCSNCRSQAAPKT